LSALTKFGLDFILKLHWKQSPSVYKPGDGVNHTTCSNVNFKMRDG